MLEPLIVYIFSNGSCIESVNIERKSFVFIAKNKKSPSIFDEIFGFYNRLQMFIFYLFISAWLLAGGRGQQWWQRRASGCGRRGGHARHAALGFGGHLPAENVNVVWAGFLIFVLGHGLHWACYFPL